MTNTNVPSWSDREKKARQEALDKWAAEVIAEIRRKAKEE